MAKIRGLDWWMHFHEDSRPKSERDHVAFKRNHPKWQKETRYMSTFAFTLCFLLFSLSSTSSTCSNHHAPPSMLYFL